MMQTAMQPLIGARITSGPRPWQVLQRDDDGLATVALEGTWYGEGPGVVEVRVAREYDNAPAPGCDWRDSEMLPGDAWRISLRVPAGGLYRIETRVRTEGVEWRNTGDKIWHIAVGDVWVIAGQSNAVGYGHGAVVDPPALGVSLFGGDEQWRMATHPIFDPTNTLYPANRDGGWVDVSPWLAFGKIILEHAGVPIGLIPTALGGSPLRSWDPGDTDPYLYNNMASMIEAAGGRVAGMVWYQGCSDANDTEAVTYLARFTRFVEAFRAQYGADLPVITAQLNRVLDYPPECNQWWSKIREAQRQAARVIPGVAVVPTLDLLLSDTIHNSAAGNVVLGERFGRTALGMVYGKDIAWRAVDARKASFDNAERTVIRIGLDNVVNYIVFLCLKLRDIMVEDEQGVIDVTCGRIENNEEAVIELARPAQGKTVCHGSYGCDPVSTLRDNLMRPVLAFYGLEVGGLFL